jgi:hypothetical protein
MTEKGAAFRPRKKPAVSLVERCAKRPDSAISAAAERQHLQRARRVSSLVLQGAPGRFKTLYIDADRA